MAGKRKAGSGGGRSRPPARKTAAAAPAGAAKKAPAKGPRTTLGKNGKPKKVRTRGAKVRRVLLYLLLVGLVGMLVVAGGFVYLYKTTELPDPNADFETNTSFVYYEDGKEELGRFAIQNRDAISYDEMPQDVKDAVVAAENRTFWSDNGVDVKGIVRAVFNNASGNATQGASTITQQYIKILYLTTERSYTRKLKEAILSLKLGRQVSKQEILEGYLNTIYFGRGAYGIQAAAQAYFGKSAAELDIKESAALASIINNPSHYDPANGKESKVALRERYRYVLDGMASRGGHHRRGGHAGRAEAAEVRGRSDRRPVRRPERPRADDGEERALDAHQRGDRGAVHGVRDRRRWPADHHDVHPEGDGRGRGGRRRGAAGGQGVRRQEPAHRRGQRARRHRRGEGASSPARTSSTARSTGRSRAGRPARR